MAKDIRQKYTLDATQAIKAIKDVSTSLERYNTQVGKLAASTKEQNAQLRNLNPRLEKYSTIMKDVVGTSGRLSRAYDTQITKTRAMSRAVSSVSTSMTKLGASTRDANTAMRVAATHALNFSQRFRNASTNMLHANRALQESSALLVEFNRQIKRVIGAISQKNAGLATQTKRHRTHTQAMNDANKASKNIIISWKSIARIIVATAIHRLVLRFAQAVLRAREEAQEFEIRIGEIRTISDRAAKSTDQWRQSLIQLSNEYGFDQLETAEGAYQALSNQVVEASTTVSFMSEEMRLARTAIVDLGDAVAATTSVLNAWHLGSEEARDTNAILMATVERGRLRLEELSNTLGRVNILSSQLGVSVLEQNSAITLLTRQGVRAEEAITLLRNVMLKLVKPTEYMTGVLNEMGFTSGRAAIATYGLIGVTEQLAERAKDADDELAEIGRQFGRIRAIVGETGLSMNDFREEVDKLIESSLDYENKVPEAFENTGRQLQIAFQRAKNVMVNEWGKPLNNIILAISNYVGGLDNALRTLYDSIRRGVTLFASYIFTIKLVIPALQSLRASMLATGTSFSIAFDLAVQLELALRALAATLLRVGPAVAIAVAIEQLIDMELEYQNFADTLDNVASSAEALSRQLGEKEFDKWARETREEFLKLGNDVTFTFRQFQMFIAGLRRESYSLAVDVEKTFKKIAKSIKDGLEAPLKAASDAIKELADKAEKIRDDVESREKDIYKRRLASEEDAFRAGLTGKEEEKKIEELNKLKITLNKRALALMAKDNTDAADLLFKRVEALQKEITSRVEALYDAASKKKDVSVSFRRRVFDPLTRRFRTVTEKVKTGEVEEDPKKAAALLKDLNRLEAERGRLVKDRILAEEAYIKRKEKEAALLEKESKERGAAFTVFKDLLAQLDAFDVGQTDAIKKFDALITEADKAAKTAGLDPKARLEFLRKAYAQRITIAREAERKIADDALGISEGVINKITEMFNKAVEERKSAQTAQQELILKDVGPSIDAILTRVSAQLDVYRQGRTARKPTVFRLIWNTQTAVDNLRASLERYKTLKTPEQLNRLTDAYQKFQRAMEELDRRRKELSVPRAFEALGIDVGPHLFEGSLEVGKKQNVKTLLKDLTELYKRVVEAQVRVAKSFAEEGDLNARLAEIQERIAKIPPEYREVAKSSKEAKIQQIIDSHNILDALDLELNRLGRLHAAYVAIARARAAAARAFPHALGGTMTPRFFAFGGGQGTDIYPAYLTKGETVMTRLASQQFAPLLHALNAATPSSRAMQGTVNFGDIHITVPEGTTDVQIDTIISGLRRRARQGLLNF